MGESRDSFFEDVLLKNIDEDIPINVDLLDTSNKYYGKINNLKNRKVYA